MAQSPTGRSDSPSTSAYLDAWSDISHLLLAGQSWSGEERKCCFLNMRNGRFATVAASFGVDFPDDGRAVATIDWDHDGDLDLWLANRTAPRVRFLRNDLSTNHHFCAFRLEGRACNRDAIGARLEVHLTGDRNPPLIKTLRAGEGFLSQSSKWLHFGLGARDKIEKLVVRWPGGSAEEFPDLAADRRYLITQGGRPVVWQAPSATTVVEPSEPAIPAQSGSARIVVVERMAVPPFAYTTFNGREVHLDGLRGGPVFVNLWASWCSPCRTELADLAHHADELASAGVHVVALSVDGLEDLAGRDLGAIRKAFAGLAVPFDGGAAAPGVVEMLERGPGLFLNKNAPLSVPSSFLFDEQGRIAVLYLGPVTATQLLADLRLLDASQADLRAAAVPFSGRWLESSAVADNRSSPEATSSVWRRVWIVLLVVAVGGLLAGAGFGIRRRFAGR